ncbi:YIP1 family protein [Bacillus sp. FSL W7-1360]
MNTWLNVWVRPRQVMKQELSKERTRKDTWTFLGLAALCAFLMFIVQYKREYVSTYAEVLITAFICAVIIAPLWLYLFAWLYKWVGSWFGGKGSVLALRVAMVNGVFKPQIIAGALCIPFILLVGEPHFLKGEAFDLAVQSYTPLQTFSTLFAALIMFTGSVWTFVVQMHTIGEAHQFSAWKSLLVSVIIVVAIVLVYVFIIFPLLVYWLT